MLKKAGKPIEHLTIEQRDNLIVTLSQKTVKQTERISELELENIALKRELREQSDRIDDLKSRIPAATDNRSADDSMCVCGYTARWHRVFGGPGGSLGSCMVGRSNCKKFVAKV